MPGPILLIDEDTHDTRYVGDLAAGQRFAALDRFINVSQRYNVATGETTWRVSLRDSVGPESEAEWGCAPTLDEAWRFALGAYFGPIDEEYDEEYLRSALDKIAGRTCGPDTYSWFARGVYPSCKCGFDPRDNAALIGHWRLAGFTVRDDHGTLVVTPIEG